VSDLLDEHRRQFALDTARATERFIAHLLLIEPPLPRPLFVWQRYEHSIAPGGVSRVSCHMEYGDAPPPGIVGARLLDLASDCPGCGLPAKMIRRPAVVKRTARSTAYVAARWQCMHGCPDPNAESLDPFSYTDTMLGAINAVLKAEAWEREFGEPLPPAPPTEMPYAVWREYAMKLGYYAPSVEELEAMAELERCTPTEEEETG
jgi:hypothetical protein